MSHIFKGNQAIAELSRSLDVPDSGMSSHWEEMHKTFSFENGALSGLSGFGDLDPPATGLRRFLHKVLQRPFRAMGSGLTKFQEIDASAANIADHQNRNYGLDILRQSLTLAWLFDKVPNAFEGNDFVAVIGDGFATFSALTLKKCPQTRVVLINLTKTLLADLVYLEKTLPEVVPALVMNKDGLDEAMADPSIRLIVLRADDYALLAKMPIRMAINIASMQEMTPDVVAGYFSVMRQAAVDQGLIFYCCNREEKTLPGGTVSRFVDYPWLEQDTILEDALCPWHQERYDMRPPFYRPFDGPHRHRLAVLTPISS